MTEKKIIIPSISMESVFITIQGISPLISGRFYSDLENKPENKTPQKQFENSIHYLPDKKYGYPAKAIQLGIINACRIKQKDVKKFKMTELRGVFNILSNNESGLLKLDCSDPDPVMFDRIVYNMGKNAIKSYYAKYNEWKIRFELIYNPEINSLEDLLYLLTLAGQFVGLGVMRPQSKDSGENGRFKIVQVERVKK